MPEPIDSPPPSYSTADVARRLGVSVPTVQRWVDLGYLKAWKTVGGHRRIDAGSVERFVADPAHAGRERPAAAPEGLAVLVVDDNALDRTMLAELVAAALPQAQVSAVDNGFDALVAIGHALPDVLITDIVMPDMNGFEMLRRLACASARPPVIVAVSVHTPRQFARLGELPPDVRFVPKPIDPRRFAETLQSALAGSAGAAKLPPRRAG